MKLRGLVFGVALTLASIAAGDADAFCGFYVGGADAKLFNDATMVVMMRDGTRTVLAMQNAYKGPPEKFAMVVPVPVVLREENVKTLPREVFDHVDQLSSPRLVEYWEQDPCAPPVPMSVPVTAMAASKGARGGGSADDDSHGVKVEAQFTVGEYQIVILSAKDSGGLETWLHEQKYTIPEGAAAYFKPYVTSGSKFFVAKVDITKVKMENGLALLSPLRFHYDTNELRLPVRLGLINSNGTQDLIVNIVGRTRFQVANYPNVTIPTNLDLAESARADFATFYTTLFDKTLEKNPKAVVTEYAWAPTNCDPCPGPALSPQDLATLGYDALVGKDGAKAPPPSMGVGTWVLTRLHARYGKDTLGDDLVFKEAPPITGGREVPSTDGALEKGAQKAEYNNFQARYAIRHPWTGAVTCKEPRRNVWGGPPEKAAPPPHAATKLGLAAHGKADVSTFLRSAVPELAIAAPAPSPSPSATTSSSASTASSASATPSEPKKGCAGCSTSPSSGAATFAPLALLLAFVLRRRR